MNRLMLYAVATNVLALATIGLFGGALVCVIIDKATLAGQLALGGLVAASATGGSFAIEVFNMGKAAGNSSLREQMYKAYDQ
jgi:hypothetical protein